MKRFIALLFALLGFAALYAVLADVTDVYSTNAEHAEPSLQQAHRTS
jgi:hypothetical protein